MRYDKGFIKYAFLLYLKSAMSALRGSSYTHAALADEKGQRLFSHSAQRGSLLWSERPHELQYGCGVYRMRPRQYAQTCSSFKASRSLPHAAQRRGYTILIRRLHALAITTI